MRESDIQCALFVSLQSASTLVMPNFSPPNWWENDVLAVTKSGYWIEHEIKVTKSDFNDDSKKVKELRDRDNGWRTGISKNKHDLLKEGANFGPNNFYFVIHEKLEGQVEIPDWAGVKIAQQGKSRVFISILKKAPRLHSEKTITQEMINSAMRSCYFRMWAYKERLAKATSKPKP